MPVPKNWQTIGGRAEANIVAALVSAGYPVFLPEFNDDMRYDLVIEDIDGSLKKIQCKKGTLDNGAITFYTCSNSYQYTKTSGVDHKRHDYRGQADFFAVFCPDNSRTYLIAVDSVGRSKATLRIDPPKNGQTMFTRWAKDFEIHPSIPDIPILPKKPPVLQELCAWCKTQPVKEARDKCCSKYCADNLKASRRPSKDELIEVLNKCKTYREAGEILGVTRVTVAKWAEIYGISK